MNIRRTITIYRIYVESEIGNSFACEETEWHSTEDGAIREMVSLLMDSCLEELEEMFKDYYEGELDFESWMLAVVGGSIDMDICFSRIAELVILD